MRHLADVVLRLAVFLFRPQKRPQGTPIDAAFDAEQEYGRLEWKRVDYRRLIEWASGG